MDDEQERIDAQDFLDNYYAEMNMEIDEYINR
jgi:hypothetical protein